MKPSLYKDIVIAPYEIAVAINVTFGQYEVRVGYLYVERNAPYFLSLDGVLVRLPENAIKQSQPIVLTEINLEIIPYDESIPPA